MLLSSHCHHLTVTAAPSLRLSVAADSPAILLAFGRVPTCFFFIFYFLLSFSFFFFEVRLTLANKTWFTVINDNCEILRVEGSPIAWVFICLDWSGIFWDVGDSVHPVKWLRRTSAPKWGKTSGCASSSRPRAKVLTAKFQRLPPQIYGKHNADWFIQFVANGRVKLRMLHTNFAEKKTPR